MDKKRLRILVVDDREDIRTLLCNILEVLSEAEGSEYEYELSIAQDGIEAVEVYREGLESGQPFDGVFMDLDMGAPEMGGEAAIKELLKIDPQVQAALCSGSLNSPVMVNFGDYGFKAVIKKPFGFPELKQALRLFTDTE